MELNGIKTKTQFFLLQILQSYSSQRPLLFQKQAIHSLKMRFALKKPLRTEQQTQITRSALNQAAKKIKKKYPYLKFHQCLAIELIQKKYSSLFKKQSLTSLSSTLK